MLRMIAVAAVFSFGVAHAEPPGLAPQVPPAADPGVPSYRFATALADGITLGMVLLGRQGGSAGLVLLSYGGFALTSPIIHASKKRSNTGLASLGMRLAFPLAGVFIAGYTAPEVVCVESCDVDPPIDRMLVGAVAGMIFVSILDVAFMSGPDRPAPKPPAWTPTLHSTREGVSFGLLRRF